MVEYKQSELWRTQLAHREGDEHKEVRDGLRVAYEQFRSRASVLANEISRTYPFLTVHDVTHLDGLWVMADVICGESVSLNPIEAFVFGGAALIHDLGNGLAAYLPDMEPHKSLHFEAFLTMQKRKLLSEGKTEPDLSAMEGNQEHAALEYAIRQLHAEHAERLLESIWTDPASKIPYSLLANPELLHALGPSIGKIAHSHWWDIDQVEKEFGERKRLGSPSGFPPEWDLDELKVALLFRLADYSHLDASRAPTFLRLLRDVEGESLKHWISQERLAQPLAEGDALVYTSSSGFKESEAEAWWLLYDMLRGLDDELRRVDSLLANRGLPRFAVRRVQDIEGPARLARQVPTKDWNPVDVRIQVSQVVHLVQHIGGTQLYGEEGIREVPLRELIQNAADAVRARRVLAKENSSWGSITVRNGVDESGRDWLEVEDTGIGMSEFVLKSVLLDFGTSLWSSKHLLSEFPDLAASEFEACGQYGIGFFSIFMWADEVLLRTRPYRDSARSTRVLHIKNGPGSRPLLRQASPQEQIGNDGGTCIRLYLRTEVQVPSEVRASTAPMSDGWDLVYRLTQIAPAMDVNLMCSERGGPEVTVVSANDWIDMDAVALIRRLSGVLPREQASSVPPHMQELGDQMTIIHDENGKAIGRGALGVTPFNWPNGKMPVTTGVLVVGGLRAAPIHNFTGVLTGTPLRAARDVAKPVTNEKGYAEWASKQALLIAERRHLYHQIYGTSKDPRPEFAIQVCALGGDPAQLPVALTKKGWLSWPEIAQEKWPGQITCVLKFAGWPLAVEEWKKPKLHGTFFMSEGIPWFLLTALSRNNREVFLSANMPKEAEGWLLPRLTPGYFVLRALFQSWGLSEEDEDKVSMDPLESFDDIPRGGFAEVAGGASSARVFRLRRK
ncbi:MAG: hypothetical protein ABI743_04615 [bacterium]